MFMMYKHPTNAEDECIYPEEVAEELQAKSMSSQQSSKEEVLNTIRDICSARCEYNHELLTFFNSKQINTN